MREELMEIIDKLRPTLKAEGGDLELVEIADDGTVAIRMTGLCGTCTATLWTHRLRIERAIHEKMPNVKVIVKV